MQESVALPIDAFDEGVLDRFARRHIVPCHLVPIRPLLDRIAGERAAVVADNHLSLKVFQSCIVEHSVRQ